MKPVARAAVRGAVAAAALAAGLVFAACRQPPEPVRVGVVLSPDTVAGAHLATREINEAGGIRGRPLELVEGHLDLKATLPDAKEVLEIAHRLGQDPDVLAVIGHSDSPSTLSASAVYNQLGLPQVVTIATHAAITSIGPWTYRLCVSDAEQGPALARYAVETWGKRRIALFYVNDEYGRDLARRFEDEARDLGAEIVARVLHRQLLQEGDRELLLREIEQLGESPQPDLVVLFQRIEAAEWTVRALRENGITSDILGGDNLGRQIFVEQDTEIKEGIRVSQFFRADSRNPRTRRFVEAHRELTGRTPEYGTAFAYDAVHVVRDALEHGGLSRRGVRGYLDRLIAQARPVEGAAGTYTLMPDHDARREIHVAELRDGAFHTVATLLAGGGRPTGDPPPP